MEQTNKSLQAKVPAAKKNGKAPAGVTVISQDKDAASTGVAPTIAEHIDTHAAAIDTQIDVLTEKKDAILATPSQGLPASIAALQKNQASIIDTEIASLSEKKASLISFLENIPAELHILEAHVFAVLKHIF